MSADKPEKASIDQDSLIQRIDFLLEEFPDLTLEEIDLLQELFDNE